MSKISPEKQNELNSSALLSLGIALGMFYAAYTYFFFVFGFLWRALKIAQMFVFYLFEILAVTLVGAFTNFHGWGFKEGVLQLLEVHYSQLTPEYIYAFDHLFGNMLKWPFAAFLIYIGIKEYKIRTEARRNYSVEKMIRSASKVHPHLRRLVPPNPFDKLLGFTLGWLVPSFKERLSGENPCDFSHDFDFKDRSSYNNRYAMGVSPTELLTANPPLGVTEDEIKRDIEMQKSTGFVTNFRPICHFFYAENEKDSTIDFCFRTATISMERLLLNPISEKIDNMDQVARLFDKNGKLLPLEYLDSNGEPTDKLKKGGAICGGFRPTTLLNEGNPYRGTIEDTYLLFDKNEQRILTQLEEKMKGKTTRSFDEILFAVVTKRHAYSTTVIWALMMLFKDVSRIAGTEFSWVMRHNRNLGMVMQSIGRETPFLEASSTRSHFLMEYKAGFGMTVPAVLGAVKDLHVNAKRILAAGKISEDLLNMDEDEFSKIFNLNPNEAQEKKESEAIKILKSMGVDVDKGEAYKDPYADVPELIKQYKESK
ncbi:hypothetical protein F7Q91_03075 [Vibrio chagasii]|uniref:DotM C-terminal cytoplasmic domain-containing protein n=1 Tax=Vibrio chagasii TaxID=170679 RepID=A0A7V7NX23_9VIBR|nr:hypothetical protein [Vibrio chagasii]KAB0482404.1 hypothetical protein F7Q91_03075 [Vibrio chagasii]